MADGATALDAWNRWHPGIVFDTIDAGSARLLPMLYWNLSRLQVDHPLMAQLKGCLRQGWVFNQNLLRAVEPVLALLEQERVPSLVLKGIPLALKVYPSMALRPMQDIDIAVPHGFSKQAFQILEGEGWRPDRAYFDDIEKYHYSITFQRPNSPELDLHFSFFQECIDWAIHAPLWAAASELQIGGARTRFLCPTDMLLHALAHGARANPVPPIRWITDATLIMRNSAPILWDRFVDLAHKLHLNHMAGQTLRYLVDRHGAQVPDFVFSDLDRGISRLQRLENRFGRERAFPFQSATLMIGRYVRSHPQKRMSELISGLPAHLQKVWQSRGLADATLVSLRKAQHNFRMWRQRSR